MKGLHLLLGFLWLSFLPVASAQLEVRIVDEVDGNPLSEVSVHDPDFTFLYVSDSKGTITIDTSMHTADMFIFDRLGYQTTRWSIVDLKKMNFQVAMLPGITIDEVVLVGRTGQDKKEIINQVEEVTAREIQRLNPSTSADALSISTGAYIQKSQVGGGSPVLRGFEANKILLVVDGVRMNNAIYRNGHLQNAITIDESALERIQVLYGPSSLKYGSDALGGVIHFQSVKPRLRFLDQKKWNASGYIRYASATGERTAHADAHYGSNRWASYTAVTLRSYGDLRVGGNRPDRFPDFGKLSTYIDPVISDEEIINPDVNVLRENGYSQIDLTQKILYQLSDEHKFLFNFQLSTSSDVPRSDMLTERDDADNLVWAEWYYGPQDRLLSSMEYNSSRATRLWEKLQFILSYQNIGESRNERRVGVEFLENRNESLSLWSATLDMQKAVSSSVKINYGLDFSHNGLTSEAYAIDEAGVQNPTILSRYPDGENSMAYGGVYMDAFWQASPRHAVLVGARYNFTTLGFSYVDNNIVQWPSSYLSGISSNNQSWTGSIGLNSSWSDRLITQASVSTAFRSPNIDDMAKIRISGEEITIPNPDLKPEKSLSAEVSASLEITPEVSISSSVYATRLSEAIVRDLLPLPDGSTSFLSNGNLFTTVGNVNKDRANLWGYHVGLKWNIKPALLFRGSYHYTYGNIIGDEPRIPLGHIPPEYGQVSIDFQQRNYNMKVVGRYNLAKPISAYGGSVDNPEFATSEGALAWMVYNAYANVLFSSSATFQIGLENVLDTHYRPFASGISAPGRNIKVTLRLNI